MQDKIIHMRWILSKDYKLDLSKIIQSSIGGRK